MAVHFRARASFLWSALLISSTVLGLITATAPSAHADGSGSGASGTGVVSTPNPNTPGILTVTPPINTKVATTIHGNTVRAAGGPNTRQQSELSIASSGSNIVVSFNDFSNGAASSVATSNDGGQTFGARFQPPPPAGSSPSGDPALVADTKGDFFFTTIYTGDGAKPTNHCTNSTHVSTDGGKTFGGIVGSPFSYDFGTTNFPDQPHPAIDRVNLVGGNAQLYMSTRHFTSGITCGGAGGSGSNQTEVTCSTNGASTWSAPSVLSPFADTVHLATGSDGSVYAVGTTNASPDSITLRRSTNSCQAGMNFGSPVTVAASLTYSSVGLDRGDTQPYVAVDKTNANVAYVAYSADSGAKDRDVFLARCSFAGSAGTCGIPVRVNDNTDPAGTPTAQYFPMLCIDPNNNILTSWDDRRIDPTNNQQTAIYAAQTTVSGSTLNVGANFRVDDAAFAPKIFSGTPNYGDFNENNDACDAKHFYVAWSSQVTPSYITPASNDIDVLFATVGKFATTTALTSSPNPSVLNQAVNFKATVSGLPPAIGTPTGTVTFFDGGSSIGAQPLSGSPATATISTTGLGLGAHTITATYSGSADFNPSTSPPLTQTVNKRPTTVTYNGSTTSDFHDATVVSATLTDNTTGTPIANKQVTFTLNGAETCSGTTDGSGLASCSITPQEAAGTYAIVATFAEDGTYFGSSDAPTFVVTHEESLLVYDGSKTSDYHDPTTVSATLTEDGTIPLAGRLVNFALNGAETCSGTTDGTGLASCSITPQEPAGTYPVTATFSQDAFYLGSTASGPFVVTHEETTLTYTGPKRIANGQPFTFTALLREDGITPISGRQVIFTLGSGSSAQTCTPTPVTNPAGVASCAIVPAQVLNAAATVTITVAFTGDPFYLPSSDAATLLLQFETGRSFGASVAVSVLGLPTRVGPTPDTGQVRTAFASTTNPPCVASISVLGWVTGQLLCANVTTSLNPGASVATATDAASTIIIPGAPVIVAQGVKATSQSSCAGTSGITSMTSLTINGAGVDVNGIKPNTTIHAGIATIVLNEQRPVPGADFGLTVNAVHVTVTGLVAADVILASATSDIHNCI